LPIRAARIRLLLDEAMAPASSAQIR